MALQKLISISNEAEVADQLGEVRAQIKALKDQQTFLEDLLKELGVESVDGDHFRVSISYGVETKRVDWRAVAEKFEPSYQLIAAHTKYSIADRVRVSAHKK